jgi:RNA polymerase sigma-70 factor (ECF subfamily)
MADKQELLKQLFSSAMLGNESDYARFLISITPLIRRLVIRRLPSADVDDVVQETLISVHKACHTYDCNRPLMPWLASIANYRVQDFLRKHYAHQADQPLDTEILENIAQDVTEQTHQREFIDQLMTGVPEHHQKILSLMHLEGYTARQVGEQIQMNESAVKVAAHRAIQTIRKKFKS